MFEHFDKLLAILLSILILVQGYLVRRMVGTWVFPACLFSLFWFFVTFIPLIVIFHAPIDPLSIGFVFIGTLAFSLSALPFKWQMAFKRNSRKSSADASYFNSRFMHRLFYLSSGLAVILVIADLNLNGFGLYAMVFNFFESASTYMKMRYSEELYVNMFGRLSTVLMYISPIAGGLIYCDAENGLRKFLIVFGAAMPSLLMMLTQSSKGALFLAIAFFYGAVLLRKIYANDLHLFRADFYKTALIYSVIIAPFLVVSFLSRDLYNIDDIAYVKNSLFRYFASYTSSHIYGFSDWFSHYLGKPSQQSYVDNFYSYGNYSFMALFDLFGSSMVFPAGVYDEYFHYEDVLISNIYTIFRGLISDFGGVGAVAFMFISGLILHLSFFRILTTRSAWIACALFICSLGYIYSSFMISLLMYNSVYIVFILTCLLLSLNAALHKTNGHRFSKLQGVGNGPRGSI